MAPDEDTPGHPRLAMASALVPPVALIGGWTIAAAVQPGGYDSVRESISSLAASATPHRWIMTTGFVLTGIAHLLTAYAVPRLSRRGRLGLGLGGLFVLGVAVLPVPSRTQGSGWHTAVATVAFVALSAWPLWSRLRGRPPPPQRAPVPLVAGAALMALTLLLGFATVRGWAWFGLVERVTAGAQALWPLAVASGAWWAAGHTVGPARVRRSLAVVALLLLAALGGTAATVVAPASVDVGHYRAQVSLSLNPTAASSLRAQTVFGDVLVGFGGFAPGILVRPQVKADITDVLAGANPNLQSFQPSQADLDAAARAASVDIAWRYLLGAVLAAGIVRALWSAVGARWRRGTHGPVRLRRILGPAVVTGLVATVATGLGASQTYRPQRYHAFHTTGLINVVQQNTGLLEDVATRSAEVTPYLRNLLALSAALRQKYAPTATDGPVAVRVLLVSDVHDGNAYALMRTIVQQEGIDAVVDAGDIATFGRAGELDAAGIPAGIAALRVPYLFVRGNHDATASGDRGVLDRLARVPNVVLLQPRPELYREASVGGIRIAGFNDPRWFGDSGTRSAAAQKPATAAFRATFTPRAADPPDVVVGHEPSAVRGLRLGAMLVNGHMHVPDLEGNRVQVGTFTGGGPFSHFLENSSGEELVGQPSAFDILAFGADCRLATLTRYGFRNVVEGRPVYDDVSLVNGSTVVGSAPAPAKGTAARTRTCDGADGLRVEDVPAVAVQDGPTATTTSGAASTPSPASTPASTTVPTSGP